MVGGNKIIGNWKGIAVTLSTGGARPNLAQSWPGPTLIGPGSGQNFGVLARPSWGQGPRLLTWPHLARPCLRVCILFAFKTIFSLFFLYFFISIFISFLCHMVVWLCEPCNIDFSDFYHHLVSFYLFLIFLFANVLQSSTYPKPHAIKNTSEWDRQVGQTTLVMVFGPWYIFFFFFYLITNLYYFL